MKEVLVRFEKMITKMISTLFLWIVYFFIFMIASLPVVGVIYLIGWFELDQGHFELAFPNRMSSPLQIWRQIHPNPWGSIFIILIIIHYLIHLNFRAFRQLTNLRTICFFIFAPILLRLSSHFDNVLVITINPIIYITF